MKEHTLGFRRALPEWTGRGETAGDGASRGEAGEAGRGPTRQGEARPGGASRVRAGRGGAGRGGAGRDGGWGMVQPGHNISLSSSRNKCKSYGHFSGDRTYQT